MGVRNERKFQRGRERAASAPGDHATGLDKGALDAEQFLEIDETARVVRGNGLPSAETGLHLAIVRTRGAGAVLHTHSLWSTLLSDSFCGDGAVSLEGFEMLKGLRGVHTHEHREILPILENCQDIAQLAGQVQVSAETRLRPFTVSCFAAMDFTLGGRTWPKPSAM